MNRDPTSHFSTPTTVASRRRALVCAAALVAAPLLGTPGAASAGAMPRTLSFWHTHTGESLSVAYRLGNAWLADGLERVNWFLRDFRNGEAHAIDPELLDQLHAIAALTGTAAPFEVISGYRSPATNEALRKRGGGVAAHSLHLEGRAIDIRLADTPLHTVRDAALSLAAGGVGFYPDSQFVHVDTGRVRRW